MKFKALNNEPFQFYNSTGELVGTISISGSGDMILRPESGSSQDVLIGNPNQVGDVEMGADGIPINLKILGGGTITGNGNTLNIGSSTDIVKIYNVVYSQSFDITGSLNITGSISTPAGVINSLSASYALTASHALNGGGGGGTTVVANPGGSPGTALTTITIAGSDFSVGGGSSFTAAGISGSLGANATLIRSLTAAGISGSFTLPSSSFSTRVTTLEAGGLSIPAGTVSGSAQITQLGFVTSSATSSFITNSQTSSFLTHSSTGSFNDLIITNPSGNLVPGNGSTSSIAVTVVSTGAGNKYVLDGTLTASISLTAGNSYKFDQSDASNGSGGSHPFRFSTDTGGTSNYSTGVTIAGSPGSAGAYTQISVTNSTPTLYYYCTNHANMGLGGVLSIITGSVVQNGFLQVTGSINVLSGSITITSGSYNGDGSGLTGIITSSYALTSSFISPTFISASAAASGFGSGGGGGGGGSTNFTQSLFVTPSGNDGTAVVGDMLKPFATILAATASANAGDTIIVYPGEYITGAQIGKDYVNYYFYPGAVVSGSVQLLSGTYEKLNIRGHGTFKTNYNGAPVGFTANGYFECDTVEFAGLQSSGYAGSPHFNQNVSADPNGVLQLKGDYKYGLINGARTGNSFNAAMRFGEGNIIANCNAFVSSSTQMMGIEIATSTTTDVIFNGDVFANNGRAVYTNDRASHVTLTGRFQTGDQATYDAIYIVPAYIGRYIINGEIVGSIHVDTGETGQSGVQIDGFQICSSSPHGSAIKIGGGYNTLNHTIRASEIIFNVDGGETHFYGAAYVSSNSTGKLFDVSAGKFVWNGMNTGDNIRALSNVISGGELVINGPLEHYGSTYPNNTFCFSLTGGTLEINNKVTYHQNTTGSGIVNMTGGYLKLNGTQLIHHDKTGSFAHCIKLTGGQTGSFFNNNFTNLNVFNNSALFLNEMAGSGSLFYTDKLY